MKFFNLFCLVVLIGSVFIIPNSTAVDVASSPTPSTGDCTVFPVIQALTIIGAGEIVMCVHYKNTVVYSNSVQDIAIDLSGPEILGISSNFLTLVATATGGCTFSGLTTAPVTLLTFGSHTSSRFTATMTSPHCRGVIEGSMSIGTTAINAFDGFLPINIDAMDAVTNSVQIGCGSSSTYQLTTTPNIITACNTPQLNNFNFWCDATLTTPSAFNPSTTNCNRPTFTMNIGTGTLTLAGTVNVVNSGTQHIIIDSWPSLTAAVTNSGTLNIQNTAGQTFAVSGTMNNVLSGTINTVESGTVAVTLPSGINVAVTSWPQLQAVISGRLDNFNFVCNATGLTPGAYNAATQICNQLQLTAVLSGTLTVAGTINVVNSGGQAISISSWPSLTAALSGNVGITFNNALTIHQDPLSGTVSVVNSGGQSISITSWPQLQAVLSGSINVHQDQACGLTSHCQFDVHQDQACGATISCLSTLNATFVNNGNMTSTSNMNVSLSLIPYYLLLIAIAFFAVFADWKGDALYWFIDLILSIYLLIIRPDNSVIPRGIFLGWIFIVAYQVIALLSNKKAKNLSGDD